MPAPGSLIVLCENIFYIYSWFLVPIHSIGSFHFCKLCWKTACSSLRCQCLFNYCYYDEVWCVATSTYCMMAFLSESVVVMKPIICNHGNNSTVMPLIKSCSAPGVLEPDQCLCRNHRDRQCLHQHIFPGKMSLASQHLPQQWRKRHLFRFPAEIQCGIFSFLRAPLWLCSRDHEATTTTDRRWRPHETKHLSECTLRGKALRLSPLRMPETRMGSHMSKSTTTTKISTVLKSHKRNVPIAALPSSGAFIINRGNHRRPLIGDALVGVSEVSGVLSRLICKLPQLGEKRQDVALSCAPPVDCEGCNLKPSFFSHHSLWLAALTPRLEHTNSGMAVWESPPLVAGIESKRHICKWKEGITKAVNQGNKIIKSAQPLIIPHQREGVVECRWRETGRGKYRKGKWKRCTIKAGWPVHMWRCDHGRYAGSLCETSSDTDGS